MKFFTHWNFPNYGIKCIHHERKKFFLTWRYFVRILFTAIGRSISSRALARVIHEAFSFLHSQCLNILALQRSGLLWLTRSNFISSSFEMSNCNPSVFQFSTAFRQIRRFFTFNVGSVMDNNYYNSYIHLSGHLFWVSVVSIRGGWSCYYMHGTVPIMQYMAASTQFNPLSQQIIIYVQAKLYVLTSSGICLW